MVLKQKRYNTDVLIVDASKGFIKVGKNNMLRASDIKKIVYTVIGRHTTLKYSKLVTRDEIRENEYNLNIPRYVDSSKNSESWDIYASMFGGIPQKEIDELKEYWNTFPGLQEALFSRKSDNYFELKVQDIKKSIMEHSSVKSYTNVFNTSFNDFDTFLRKELLSRMDKVLISKEETIISEDIFDRLKNIPLIDKYEAYQILDDVWNKIAVDLEIIQTEGFESVKKVDPVMVTKKKNGKDQEIQEGWCGHVIPFELVQKTLLKDNYNKLKIKESRLTEITSEYEEILDSLSEEEKESDTVNEAKNGFIAAEVNKEVKQITKDIKNGETFANDSYEVKILKIGELLTEEKNLKSKVKSESAKLHILTKETIEKLSNEEVFELLEVKWIAPLVTSLNNLPEEVINKLAIKIKALSEKYETTYEEVINHIHHTENTLVSLIDELTGNEYDIKGLNEFKSLLKGE